MSPDTREALAFIIAMQDDEFLAEPPTEKLPPRHWAEEEKAWVVVAKTRRLKGGNSQEGGK